MDKKSFWYGTFAGFMAAVLISGVIVGAIVALAMMPLENPEDRYEEYEQISDKLEDIDRILDSKYYEKIDRSKMLDTAIKGYVAGIGDPYTDYYSKEEFNSFMEDSAGSYEGIGVVITYGENGTDLEVLSPFAGSPGEKAGMLPGDRILEVDGKSVEGMKIEEAVELIKGEKGTPVVIKIYRKSNQKTMDINIIRDVINMETVAHEMLPGKIGYISISGFQEVTYDQFKKALTELEKQGQKSLIIDLRNNPGGLVDSVAQIADEILPEGLIVYTQDKNGEKEEIFSDKEHQFTKPMVILVNEYSASASEILAGAIKDYELGTIVGNNTFGKGLVQSTFQLDDGSAVKVTIAKYYTPDGNYINGTGIKPDVEVSLPEELKEQFYVEKDQDTQLKKAIEILSAK